MMGTSKMEKVKLPEKDKTTVKPNVVLGKRPSIIINFFTICKCHTQFHTHSPTSVWTNILSNVTLCCNI